MSEKTLRLLPTSLRPDRLVWSLSLYLHTNTISFVVLKAASDGEHGVLGNGRRMLLIWNTEYKTHSPLVCIGHLFLLRFSEFLSFVSLFLSSTTNADW